jgi:hypothetical protein
MPAWGVGLLFIGAVACCGLCGYGIARAVRRSRERRAREAGVLTDP